MHEQPEPTIYEQLCLNIYAYQFGHIGFLELVEQFESLLSLRSSDQTEVLDGDSALAEYERE